MAKTAKSLADPTRLEPISKQDGTLQVIIETPKGSRNKYAFDPKQEIFSLTKVLPAGMCFPYDFGFFAARLSRPTGDPIDAIAPHGRACLSRVARISRSTYRHHRGRTALDGKKRIRNDRLVAIAQANHMYNNVRKLKDLPDKFVHELQVFFVNYHNLEGKQYKLLGCKGIDAAMTLIKQAQKAA